MTPLPTVDFGRIRHHAGSQNRAFEELAYLLAWDLEGLNGGTEIERRSTPDGGVEFSCLPAGGQRRWAWQAKYLFRFDKSTFNQMTESVMSALDSTPDLARYIFVLPKDRSAVGIRKWDDKVARWVDEADRRGMQVEFQFRGESELVAALADDRHAGAIRYFFDAHFLTLDHFSTQVRRQTVNLGPRYDPRVNVETDARRVINAACRGPRFLDDMARLLDAPLAGAAGAGAPHQRSLYVEQGEQREAAADAGIETVRRLLKTWQVVSTSALDRVTDPESRIFRELKTAAAALKAGIESETLLVDGRVEELEEESRRALSRRKATVPTASRRKRKSKAEVAEAARERRRKALRDLQTLLYRIERAVDEVIWYLQGDEVDAANNGAVLLVGEAGCGKSHLVADVAKDRIAADLPTLLFLGQQFVMGSVDSQIVEFARLAPTMALPDVLQAIDIAARVRRRGRALLIVDAVNEGAGADLWTHQLQGFVTEVAKYEWIALVVTVRDVYEPAIAPNPISSMTRATHHGLAGHEEEALALYAELYGLRLPDIPALLPELSNPLFLRSLCVSVQARGLGEIPREAASLGWVFEGLIEAVDKALQPPSRLNYGDWEKKVAQAVRSLASAMVDAGAERLSLSDANAICLAIHADQRGTHSLLNGLIVEGLLLRERSEHDGRPSESVRFTYQRLSDHVRAEVLLDRHPANADLAEALRSIASGPRPWAMSGVIGALALLVPEIRGKELANLLRLGSSVLPRYGLERGPTKWLKREVQAAFVDTLIWRSPSSFTNATWTLIERYHSAGFVEEHQWLHIITGLACVPSHPLNVEWLDPLLRRMPLPERDRAWSSAVAWVYSDDANPVSRTIDWAWARSEASEEVAALVGRFLCWLLTSPNRRLRDTSIKATVAVTRHHTPVLTTLVREFAAIDDLQVLDGLIAAAYGHVLRNRPAELPPQRLDELFELARAVFDAAFGVEPKAHLMLRHHARACVEAVVALSEGPDRTLGRDLSIAQPPYGSPWPIRAPRARKLTEGFGRSYEGHLVTELDWEFERNVKKNVLELLVVPDQTRRRAARRRQLTRELTNALDALLTLMPPSRKEVVRRQVTKLLTEESSSTRSRAGSWDDLERRVSRKALQPLRRVRIADNALRRVDSEVFHPDPDLCLRWVAARVLELGWTKEQFGERDDLVRQMRRHDVDRIAEKYERIAFQELCGHLVDHCLLQQYPGDDPQPYHGPWEIYSTLTVDPSLLLRGDEPQQDTAAARLRDIRLRTETQPAWWRTFSDHRLADDGDDDDWLADASDIPRPELLLVAIDPEGQEWVAVERHETWSFKDPGDLSRGYRRDKRVLWFRSQACLIRGENESSFARWAANTNWMGLHHVSTARDISIGYLGEYPDIEPWPSELDLGDRERRPYEPHDDPGLDALPWGWEFARISGTVAPYAVATTWSHIEGTRDFSAFDTPPSVMPSRVLLQVLNACWSGGTPPPNSLELGPVEAEYSWVNDDQVVAFCSSGRSFGSTRALWVRADHLRHSLKSEGLTLWSWTLGEKIYWRRQGPSSNRTDCFGGVKLAPDPLVVWGYTVDCDRQDRHDRVLTERAAGIPSTEVPE